MPVSYVTRYKSTFDPTLTKYRGTQYIDGQLKFDGVHTITLNDTIFNSPGNYVLFQYGSFPGGQSVLDAYIKPYLDGSQLTYGYLDITDPAVLIDNVSTKQIILKLKTLPTVGKQYINGNLTLENGFKIKMSKDLYKTAGVYEIFETLGGTITMDSSVRAYMIGNTVLKAGIPYLTDGDTKLKVDVT